MQKTVQSLLSGAGIGVGISILILIILFTNQLNEFKKYMPIAELDFSDNNELYRIDSARIYSMGKGVAPNEKLQLIMHVTNKQDFTLTFRSDVRVSIGGELGNHLANLKSNEVSSKSSKDIEFDFYLADEGPNEIIVLIKPYFPNGTLIETEPVSTTIDVVSLSNQLQLEQNKYTSYGIIISATIGIATVIALIASLYYSRKEIGSLESQNNILKEESVRPYLQPTIVQKGPVNIVLGLKNVGTGAAIQVNFEYELEGKPETKRSWKKPLVEKEKLTNFLIPVGAGLKDFQLSYEYFKQNPTKIITKITCENIHGKKYAYEETIDVTEYVSQFERTLEEAGDA